MTGSACCTQGTDRVGGAVDTDALERYFATAPQLSPPALNRIDVVVP